MSKRKKRNIPIWKHNPKETSCKDRFIQIHHDMLMNKNFLSLSNSSKVVYMYMVDYSVGNMEFVFPHGVYKNIVSNETFQKNVRELVEKGFIEVIATGKNTRTPNQYRFSNKWYSSS